MRKKLLTVFIASFLAIAGCPTQVTNVNPSAKTDSTLTNSFKLKANYEDYSHYHTNVPVSYLEKHIYKISKAFTKPDGTGYTAHA